MYKYRFNIIGGISIIGLIVVIIGKFTPFSQYTLSLLLVFSSLVQFICIYNYDKLHLKEGQSHKSIMALDLIIVHIAITVRLIDLLNYCIK